MDLELVYSQQQDARRDHKQQGARSKKSGSKTKTKKQKRRKRRSLKAAIAEGRLCRFASWNLELISSNICVSCTSLT